MVDYKCNQCKTLWKTNKPSSKHLLFDTSKNQTLQTGKGSCTCSAGEDGLQPQ